MEPDAVKGRGQGGEKVPATASGRVPANQPQQAAPDPAAGHRPWQKIRHRFFQHKLAVAGTVIIAFLYLLALFAPFIAPYNFETQNSQQTYAPPTPITFRDAQGRFTLRPHVLGLSRQRDPVTYELVYRPDPKLSFPLRFFVRGERYSIVGPLTWDVHLFGLDPSADARVYLMGTDRFGRDLFSRVLMGSRVSLTVGIFGICLSFMLGTIIGGISGYYGGTVDTLIQRFIELLRSFPRIPLWLALSLILPPTWSSVQVYFGVVTILSLIDWTGVARVVRGQFLSFRKMEFVEAARSVGASDARIIFRHILPNILTYIIVAASLSFPGMIIGESSISFLGLGIKEPMTSWGLLLKDAQTLDALSTHPWLLLPGLFIIVSVLAFNFMGDGLRDAFDPYSSRGR